MNTPNCESTKICHWTHNTSADYWDTECGERFLLSYGTPIENKMKYCPFCGGVLIEGRKAK